MPITKEIKTILDQLVEIKMSKGVQPSDLAQAIFDKEYTETKVVKSASDVVLSLKYIDKTEDSTQEINMRYHYSLDGYLQEIYESIAQRPMALQWSRTERYKELTNSIVFQLTTEGEIETVSSFIKSLPEDIRSIILDEKSNVA